MKHLKLLQLNNLFSYSILINLFIFLNACTSSRNYNSKFSKDIHAQENTVTGTIWYRFREINNNYCLQDVLIHPDASIKVQKKKINEFYLYDERIVNYQLIKDEPIFENFLGSRKLYLYNSEKINSEFNLKNTSAIYLNTENNNNKYFKSDNVYQSLSTSEDIIIVFNFSGKINICVNATQWAKRDSVYLSQYALVENDLCSGVNFNIGNNFAILNQCDSVWPLSLTQINKFEIEKSYIDSLNVFSPY